MHRERKAQMTPRTQAFALFTFAGICLALAFVLSACSSQGEGATSASVAGVGDVCTADADCAASLECEHGTCQPHNRNRGDAGVAEDEDDDHDADVDEP